MRKNSKPAVLIMNQNASALAEMTNHLAADYHCLSADSVEQAMSAVKQSADPIPVVMCDVAAPQSDGLKLAHTLRLYCPEIVCILMTADSRQAVEVLEDGRDFYLLQKPFAISELNRIVKSALEEHRRRMSQKTFTWKVRFNDQNLPNLIMGPGSLCVTGYRAGEFQADTSLWKSIIVSQDIPRMDEFLNCIQTQQPVDAVDFRIRRKDMRSRWLRMAFLTEQCANNMESFEVDGFLEDITDQKEMELAISQANKRYERMASNVPGLVFHCLLQIDGSLRFTFVSPSCRQLFDLEPEQICTDSGSVRIGFLQYPSVMRLVQLMEMLMSVDW